MKQLLLPTFHADVKMIFGAKWADSKSLSKVPSSEMGIFERCKKNCGFVPYFIRKMQHPAAQKAFAFGFLLRINQGSDEVSVALKQIMCFQCSTNAGNTVLRAHYAYLAMRNGVSLERLMQISDETSTGGGESAAEDAAMALAQAARCVNLRRRSIMWVEESDVGTW